MTYHSLLLIVNNADDLKVKSPIFLTLNENSSTGVSKGTGPSTSATCTNVVTRIKFFHQNHLFSPGFSFLSPEFILNFTFDLQADTALMVVTAKIQQRFILWRNSDLPINVFLFCCFFWTFGVCPSALLWILCWLQKSLKIVRNAIERLIFLKSQFSARGNTIFCEEKSSVCQFWASRKLQY